MRTKEYCGFMFEDEQKTINKGDIVVYFGQGIIFGIFEAIDLVNNEYNGWKKKYPYQVKLKPLLLSQKGLIAKQLQEKFIMLREENKLSNIVELTENEYNLIKKSIEEGRKEL
jgi:hypothetical protein